MIIWWLFEWLFDVFDDYLENWEHVPNFAFARLCSLKILEARPAQLANTIAVWCEGEGAMVGTQAEDREQGMWGDRDGVVFARARERVPHTPVRLYARTHAHTHAQCMCLYVHMFESVSVCTSARSEADNNTTERRRTDAAPETRYCIFNTRIAVSFVGLLRIRLSRRQFVNLSIWQQQWAEAKFARKLEPKVMG